MTEMAVDLKEPADRFVLSCLLIPLNLNALESVAVKEQSRRG